MIDWFQRLSGECYLEAFAARALEQDGFAVIDGPASGEQLDQLVGAYDRAMGEAEEPDKRVGRQSTRVHDFVNRGAAFDSLYQFAPFLAACCETIRQPFKLSNMLGRTLHPKTGWDDIHVDFARDQDGSPMLGFIIMIDEFTQENGATRFWAGSHHHPAGVTADRIPESELVPACGPQGAIVVYNGSVRHGHGPNLTDRSRRSIQGAYIRRHARGFGLPARMRPETLGRIGPLAEYLIAV